MHVLDGSPRKLHPEVFTRKIPYPPHSRADSAGSGAVRHTLRQGENGDVHGVIPDKAFKLAYVQNGHGANAFPNLIRVNVKGGDELRSAFFKAEIEGEGFPEVSEPDNNSSEPVAHTEGRGYPIAELGDVVPVPLLTEAAEAVEVLPYLGCCNPHYAAEFAGGDLLHPLGRQKVEIADIPRKSFYHVVGNFVVHVKDSPEASYYYNVYYNRLPPQYQVCPIRRQKALTFR